MQKRSEILFLFLLSISTTSHAMSEIYSIAKSKEGDIYVKLFDKTSARFNNDGSSSIIFPNSRAMTTFSNGFTRITLPNKTHIIMDQNNDTTIILPSRDVITSSGSAAIKIENYNKKQIPFSCSKKSEYHAAKRSLQNILYEVQTIKKRISHLL